VTKENSLCKDISILKATLKEFRQWETSGKDQKVVKCKQGYKRSSYLFWVFIKDFVYFF